MQKPKPPRFTPAELAELLERARLAVKRYRLLHPEWPHAPQHQAMIERLDDLEVPQLAQQRAGETPAPVSKPDDLHPAAYHHPALAYPVA